MKVSQIVGLAILMIIISVGTYSYMDYQEKKQLREAYDVFLQEIEAKKGVWDEEVNYYENLTHSPIPGSNGKVYFVINGRYEYGKWKNYIEWYGAESETPSIIEIRNVTRMELRTEINEWMQYQVERRIRTEENLAKEGRSPLYYSTEVSINIDCIEGVIFIRRWYADTMDQEPFEGTILICWRP